MRVIPTAVHGATDYLLGTALLILPWIGGFARGMAETWVPVIFGAAIIIYSLLTDYELGLVGVLTVRTHLALDVVLGLGLAASPWLLGFSGVVWGPHLVAGVLLAALALRTLGQPFERAVSGPRGTPTLPS